MKETRGLRKVLQKIYQLLDFRQKRNFVFIIIIMILSAGLTQLTPKAVGQLTDDILVGDQVDFFQVIPFLIFILVVNVVNELIKILRRVMVEDTATRTEKKARGIVVRSLLKAPLSYFKKNMTGNIHGRLNRCLEGTVKLEKLLFMDFAPAIFNSIAAIAVIFTTLPVILALPMLLVIPIGTAIVFRQISTQRGIRVELLETKSAMDGTVVELLNGIEVIRITDSVGRESERLDGRSEFLRRKEMKHHLQMAKYDSLKFINEAVFTVLMIGISTWLATKGVITVGSVLTAYLCFAQLIKPLEELHRILDELSECMVLAEDFFRMVELPADFSYLPVTAEKEKSGGSEKTGNVRGRTGNGDRSLKDAGGAVAADKGENTVIRIRNLQFSYEDDKTVLDGINLDIRRGMFLGIAGPSGCGKSSLIKAVCKLEPAKGSICINGRETASLSRQDIAGMIALVPQNPFLIAGTIYENICYGTEGEVSEAEVEEAARRAYIYDFINSLPLKFNTQIAEGGGNLSGGQKQRIAIARIFLRRPEVVILDEATSALDNTSERHIQREIEQMKERNGVTVISIAHRLTTLENCDEILVFERGHICQRGKYKELVEQEGIFRDMYHGMAAAGMSGFPAQ